MADFLSSRLASAPSSRFLFLDLHVYCDCYLVFLCDRDESELLSMLRFCLNIHPENESQLLQVVVNIRY